MPGKFHTEAFERIPADKRERVLRAAAHVLGRDGVHRARIGDIAKEAGVSHGSIFTYFPTKEDLVRALVVRGAQTQRELFAALRAKDAAEGRSAEPPKDALAEAMRFVSDAYRVAASEPSLISLWLSFGLEENERFAEEVVPFERELFENMRGVVDRAAAQGALREDLDPAVAGYIVAAVSGQLMKSRVSSIERAKHDMYFEGRGLDPEAAMRLVLEGLERILRR